jgi:hypothetical protein
MAINNYSRSFTKQDKISTPQLLLTSFLFPDLKRVRESSLSILTGIYSDTIIYLKYGAEFHK